MPSPLSVIRQARAAISLLNPQEVEQRAHARFTIGLAAATLEGFADMEDFLGGGPLPPFVYRVNEPRAPEKFDIVLYEQGMPCPADAFTLYRADPLQTVTDILAGREDLSLALARNFPAFRGPLVEQTIRAVAKENAMFALATALPNILPSLLQLPWSIGEFASDSAFLTMNQVRMAFVIAAAHGKPVGYGAQRIELASIIGSAFGWRALARELVGKIPLGGGLIPKGAIAYAATFVIGKGLDQLARLGRKPTPQQRRDVYDVAYKDGRRMAEEVADQLRRPA